MQEAERNERITEEEQTAALIDEYTRRRIKAPKGRDEEIEYPIKITRAKLEALGIMTEHLDK